MLQLNIEISASNIPNIVYNTAKMYNLLIDLIH